MACASGSSERRIFSRIAFIDTYGNDRIENEQESHKNYGIDDHSIDTMHTTFDKSFNDRTFWLRYFGAVRIPFASALGYMYGHYREPILSTASASGSRERRIFSRIAFIDITVMIDQE